MGAEYKSKGGAGRMACIDRCAAESEQCKGEGSLDSEFKKTVLDNGKMPLSIVRS